MEVADLEDDVAGLETRIHKIKEEINELEDEIVNRKNTMKQAAASIKKYEEQQNNVKNNREYEALSKEIEIQGLDIQVSEKKIKEYTFEIGNKTRVLEVAEASLVERHKDLDLKKSAWFVNFFDLFAGKKGKPGVKGLQKGPIFLLISKNFMMG